MRPDRGDAIGLHLRLSLGDAGAVFGFADGLDAGDVSGELGEGLVLGLVLYRGVMGGLFTLGTLEMGDSSMTFNPPQSPFFKGEVHNADVALTAVFNSCNHPQRFVSPLKKRIGSG